ncbi:hypothetical protein M3J09_009147 [Ascochyta lentis]
MKLSFITCLLAQALIVSATRKYCNTATPLKGGGSCEGIAAKSLCCANNKSADRPNYHEECYTPTNDQGDEVDELCTGGGIYCCN